MKRSVAIINYNTPEMTEAAIRSLRKQCAERYPVYVFDNSDKRPFTARLAGVSVFDNTKGQLVDFDAELEKYPSRCFSLAEASNFGSMKHCMSVQKLFELLPDGFILLESDVILRKDIGFIWDERYAAVGTIQKHPRGNFYGISRLLPYLCYLNVPLLTKYGARYYDPNRCWMLQEGEFTRGNWYDTGASILEDIVKTKPQLVCLNYPSLSNKYLHYAAGSWRRNDLSQQMVWIEKHRILLSDEEELDETPATQDAKIYICAHTDFAHRVSSPVYETLDARAEGDVADNGLKGSFYSEILVLHRLAARKVLPKIVGTCGYRKYWTWMDKVPDLAGLVAAHGCVVSERVKLGATMREHYGRIASVEDLDILTRIIERRNKAFAPAWHKALDSKVLHPASMFVMQAKDFRRMMRVVWNLLEEYLKVVGTDIDARLSDNAKAYHLDKTPRAYQYRIGGQLGERIISAWIDWQFPKAMEMPFKTFAQAR